jgi:hypothetical protein
MRANFCGSGVSYLLDVDAVKERLKTVISADYSWPEMLAGWNLVFIAHSNSALEMDLLHPVSGNFWSEDNEPLKLPVLSTGNQITIRDLKNLGVPFMTTFGHAVVSEAAPARHLHLIRAGNGNEVV